MTWFVIKSPVFTLLSSFYLKFFCVLQISIIHPPDYAAAFLVLLAMVLLATLVYLKQDDLEVFYNKTIWATATLVRQLSLSYYIYFIWAIFHICLQNHAAENFVSRLCILWWYCSFKTSYWFSLTFNNCFFVVCR